MKTIRVIYTSKKIPVYGISNYKQYSFLCDLASIKEEDIIYSKDYNTPMQVVSISNCDEKIQNNIKLKLINIYKVNDYTLTEGISFKYSPEDLKEIKPYLEKWGYNITALDGNYTYLYLEKNYISTYASYCDNEYLVDTKEDFLRRAAQLIGVKYTSEKLTIKKESNMEKKSMFKSIIEKYKSQFIPEKDDTLKLSIDGNICILVGEEYVGIDKDNNLINYPQEMCMDNMPIYLLNKPYTQVQVGDIIKINNSYSKVLKKNSNGTLSCLSFSGHTQNKKEIKDFILNQSFVKVVVNIFNNNQEFNPIMLCLLNDNTEIKDILLMQMMHQNNNQMNSILMMAMMDKDNSMFETMMMMQMMKDQINFPFMINQNNKE